MQICSIFLPPIYHIAASVSRLIELSYHFIAKLSVICLWLPWRFANRLTAFLIVSDEENCSRRKKKLGIFLMINMS